MTYISCVLVGVVHLTGYLLDDDDDNIDLSDTSSLESIEEAEIEDGTLVYLIPSHTYSAIMHIPVLFFLHTIGVRFLYLH